MVSTILIWNALIIISLAAAMYFMHRKSMLYAQMKFSVLVSISQVFKKEQPLRKIFLEIIQIITLTVPSIKSGAVVIFNNDGNFKVQAVTQMTEQDFRNVRFPSSIIKTIRSRKECVTWAKEKIFGETNGATLCPIVVNNEVVGIFILFHRRQKINILESGFLNTLSRQISLEFEDRLLQTKLDAFSKGLSMVEYSYEKIVDNLPTGIVAIDLDGRILLWNKAMEQMRKRTSNQTIGMFYEDIFDNNQKIRDFIRNIRRTSTLTQITEYRYSLDGEEFVIEIIGYPLFDMQNNVIAHIIKHRNITKEAQLQRRLQETQERTNRELTEKVRLATKELRDANEELIRLNRIKSEFVSTISHELKTPLTSIKGYIALLLSGKFGTISDSQKTALAVVNEQSDRLNKLITDVLDLSRLEAGKTTLSLEEIYPGDIIDSAVDVMLPQADSKSLSIIKKYQTGVRIHADKIKLYQVVLNLLSNAVKFTPNNGKITIGLREHKGLCVIDVKDTGVGIEPDKLVHIFEPFYQVQGHLTRDVSGTGLGLTIVKHIVELHNGQTAVSSEVGKGTTFTITLPKTQ